MQTRNVLITVGHTEREMTVFARYPKKSPTGLDGQPTVGTADCLRETLNIVVPKLMFTFVRFDQKVFVVPNLDEAARNREMQFILRRSKDLYPVRIMAGLENATILR